MKRQRQSSTPRKRAAAASKKNKNLPQPSQKQQQPSKQDGLQEEEILLTPHTLRLLKLIQEGSHDHASMAALQLTSITAVSSPLVLWDVLGRLQSFLTSSHWQTRTNASRAMQGVAKHLPPKARQQFLERVLEDNNQSNDIPDNDNGNVVSNDDYRNDNTHNTSSTKKDYLWLTLQNVQNELPAIVQQGRLLWAYADEDLDPDSHKSTKEDEILKQLDQQQLQKGETMGGDGDTNEFVQRRIQWQRRILAQRVGLSGLLQATGGAAGSCLVDAITSEDLDLPLPAIESSSSQQSSSNAATTKPTKRQRKAKGGKGKPKASKRRRKGDGKGEDSNDNGQKSVMRALLVMEMKREQSSSHTLSLTHNNPQALLATELLYRVFDPSWYVRHGALLGLLSLLRAWHGSTIAMGESATTSAPTFGAWPNDILARCIAVLVLDRFGDYSGTTTTQNTEISADITMAAESGSVVAPARETAGQLLSMVWHMAPSIIQQDTLQLLYKLANPLNENNKADGMDRANDWEIRHGALLALKYIVAVQAASKQPVNESLSEIATVAIDCLSDQSDDAQAVAAQILSTLVASSFLQEGIRERASQQVWKVLARARGMASSILDLMNLCSSLLQRKYDAKAALLVDPDKESGGDSITGATILDILKAFLDHDLMSVRLAALRSIASVAEPIWNSTHVDEEESKTTLTALDCVQERIFDSFLRDDLPMPLSSSGQDDISATKQKKEVVDDSIDMIALSDFVSCRAGAWSRLVRVFERRSDQQRSSLANSLILRYFGVSRQHSERSGPAESIDGQVLFPRLLQAAEALSDVLCTGIAKSDGGASMEQNNGILHVLELALCTFLHSPWIAQCEASCLLLRATFNKLGNGSGPLLAVLESCRHSVVSMLTVSGDGPAPVCLAVEHINAKETIKDASVVQLRDNAFVNGVELIEKNCSEANGIADAADRIRRFWSNSIQAKVGSEGVYSTSVKDVADTNSSMRFYALLAGTSLAGNKEKLPTDKATPLIRPIMTSLKNEIDPSRLNQSCDFIVELLCMMFTSDAAESETKPSPFLRVREKVLDTMCAAICRSDSCSFALETRAFARVMQIFTKAMSRQHNSLEFVPPIWKRLQLLQSTDGSNGIFDALNLLYVVSDGLPPGSGLTAFVIDGFLPPTTKLACQQSDAEIRTKCKSIIQTMSSQHTNSALPAALPVIMSCLEDRKNDSYRLWSCELLETMVETVGLEICPFVRRLLRLVMSLMADPVTSCARTANGIFARLVRVAPLVRCEMVSSEISKASKISYDADSVVDHLIHGKPLPPYSLPQQIKESLLKGGITLRPYQMEGVAWLRFLQSVHLNGALCDSMGLGKTLQALIGVAISHIEGEGRSQDIPQSLVVCPSSVVGHWAAEIEKFFPDRSVFRSLALMGNGTERKNLWKTHVKGCNIVVTSYSTLRSDIELLSKPLWRFCILDEGHLLVGPATVKNPHVSIAFDAFFLNPANWCTV